MTLVAVSRPEKSQKHTSALDGSDNDRESQKASHISRISFDDEKVVFNAAGKKTMVSTGSEIMQETPLF